MRLYEKAKRLGIWNPSDFDFSEDKIDWARLSEDERDFIRLLLSLFVAGEEAVAVDLLPLVQVLADEGRIEDSIYLTNFLYEEAKHTDFFQRVLDEVVFPVSNSNGNRIGTDLSRYHSPNYKRVFYEALPRDLLALKTDKSPKAQIRAATTYNMIVEGVLAETGYHTFHAILHRNNIMPTLRRGVLLVKQDESRHIAYGIYLISRLLSENPSYWEDVVEHMNSLLMEAVRVIGDIFARYEDVPFDLKGYEFVNFAQEQYFRRLERLDKSRAQPMDEIVRIAQEIDEA